MGGTELSQLSELENWSDWASGWAGIFHLWGAGIANRKEKCRMNDEKQTSIFISAFWRCNLTNMRLAWGVGILAGGSLIPLGRQSRTYTSHWLELKGCFPHVAAFPPNSCRQTLAELPTKKVVQNDHVTHCQTAPVQATGFSTLWDEMRGWRNTKEVLNS